MPVRPLQPTSLPHLEVMLTDDGSRTLFHRELNETYHSGCGALSECLHVYLRNSGIEDMLIARADQSNQALVRPLRVLEVGFGTGMGWLLTAAAAEVHQCPIQYISLEHDLLPADVLAQIDTTAAVNSAIEAGWLPASYAVMGELETAWLALRSGLSSATDIQWHASRMNHLHIGCGEACEWLANHQSTTDPMDAIYFDAFSPATSPSLWQVEMFTRLKQWLHPGGRLVSYCVSGHVRRALQTAGFQVERHPGPPGGKREVLVSSVR